MTGSFCWFCCAVAHICNIGKGFMHFKNLQVFYLYWTNILDVLIESIFHADEHVIHVSFLLIGLCMWFLCVYTCTCRILH